MACQTVGRGGGQAARSLALLHWLCHPPTRLGIATDGGGVEGLQQDGAVRPAGTSGAYCVCRGQRGMLRVSGARGHVACAMTRKAIYRIASSIICDGCWDVLGTLSSWETSSPASDAVVLAQPRPQRTRSTPLSRHAVSSASITSPAARTPSCSSSADDSLVFCVFSWKSR